MAALDERTEQRTKSLVRARLRGSGLERDACILDLSPQGLLITAAVPPKCDHPVTVAANGYTISGQVRWVEDGRFGVSLDQPIVVEDVVEAKILAPKPREASAGLPENFGARPVPASASLGFSDYFKSKWTRYGLIAAVSVGGAIYVGNEVGQVFGGMSEQLAAVQQASGAEGEALGQ